MLAFSDFKKYGLEDSHIAALIAAGFRSPKAVIKSGYKGNFIKAFDDDLTRSLVGKIITYGGIKSVEPDYIDPYLVVADAERFGFTKKAIAKLHEMGVFSTYQMAKLFERAKQKDVNDSPSDWFILGFGYTCLMHGIEHSRPKRMRYLYPLKHLIKLGMLSRHVKALAEHHVTSVEGLIKAAAAGMLDNVFPDHRDQEECLGMVLMQIRRFNRPDLPPIFRTFEMVAHFGFTPALVDRLHEHDIYTLDQLRDQVHQPESLKMFTQDEQQQLARALGNISSYLVNLKAENPPPLFRDGANYAKQTPSLN